MTASITLECPQHPRMRTSRTQGFAAGAVRGLTHTIASSFEQNAPPPTEWDSLVEATGGDVFTTYHWCRVWWRHYGHGRRLQIHQFRDGERVVGIVPLFAESLGFGPMSLSVLRLVGCDHSVSTCGFAVLPNYVDEVISRLLGHPDVQAAHALVLGPLAGYAEAGSAFARALEHAGGFRVRCELAAPQMVFDIPCSYEAFLSSLSKKQRYEFRNEEKRWQKAGHSAFAVRSDPKEMATAFDSFTRLHQTYWEAQRKLGHFGDWPSSVDFHREAIMVNAGKGRSFFCECMLDGELISSEYCHQLGGRLHWFLTARRPDVGGRVGFGALVRECCGRGISQIDGMCGYYDYKKWMGARVVHQTRILAVRDDLFARLRTFAFTRAARGLDLLYYRLWFSRIAPRVPRRMRRPLWRSWIRSRI